MNRLCQSLLLSSTVHCRGRCCLTTSPRSLLSLSFSSPSLPPVTVTTRSSLPSITTTIRGRHNSPWNLPYTKVPFTQMDPPTDLTLDQLRDQLRTFDVNCNGKLELSLNDESGIATLCINSPARKNAFSGYMMAQFSDILTQLEAWQKGRAVIIYGAEGFFCSGADLKTVSNLSDTCGAYYISTVMHDNLRRFERLPLVSVALVEGSAIGGGAEMATACDLRVFASTAQIGYVHARLGVTPGFGGGVRLIRLLGATKALQMMLSAKPINTKTASELGLIQHILPEGVVGANALKSTIEWFQTQYGSITSSASRNIKNIVTTSRMNLTLNEALDYEAQVFQQVWGSDEHKQALAANIKHN